MSQTSRKVDQFLELFDEMDRVFHSEASWETKFDLVFSVVGEMRDLGFEVDYYDPDTSYAEDTRAAFEAYRRKALELAKAFNLTSRWNSDEESS